MANYIKSCFQVIKTVATSPIHFAINKAVGISAGIGGLIVSLPIFTPIKFESEAQIDGAISALPLAFGLSFIAELMKIIYTTSNTQKLTNDKILIDKTLLNLAFLDTTNNDDPNIRSTHQYLLGNFIKYEENQLYTKELEEAILRNLQSNYYESFLKYFTSTLNFSIVGLISLSGIFVNFIVPMILKEELNNQAIKDTAIPIAATFALYASLVAIAESYQFWGNLTEKREDVSESVQQFVNTMAVRDQAMIPKNISDAMGLWKRKHLPPQPATTTTQPETAQPESGTSRLAASLV